MPFTPFSRRGFLQSTAALAGAAALPKGAFASRRADRRLHLCRSEGRFRLQPSPCRGRGRRQGDRSGVKVIEEENVRRDRSMSRNTMESMINFDGAHAAVPDLLRLFRSAHSRGRAEDTRMSASSIAAGLCVRTDKHPEECRLVISAISAWVST